MNTFPTIDRRCWLTLMLATGAVFTTAVIGFHAMAPRLRSGPV